MRILTFSLALCSMLGLSIPVSYAQEAKVVLRSTVIGNQEQPKVLYILPWQKAEGIEWDYQPLQSLVNGVFEEVDRAEFLRELQYQQKINAALESAQ